MNPLGTVFFAAYAGPSMNPTLRAPELMEIVPYGKRPLRVGDVVLFRLPRNDQLVVHRIARVTPAGLSTRGDNNSRDDASLLQPQDIKGRVVAAWRGQRRRGITGGQQGRLAICWLRWRRVLGRGVSDLLHPLYQALSRRGLIAWLLPAPLRPRVMVLRSQGRDQFRLLWGRHVVGRYHDRKRQWQIQRPFRLFVDERVLPRHRDEHRTGLLPMTGHSRKP